MMPETKNAKSEAEIRKLIDEEINAIRFKDVEKLMPYYAEDVLLFDVVDPLQYTGAKEVRQRMEGWFSTFSGNIGYEVSGLKISAGEDIAVCHRLNHVSAETLSGGKLDMWWRDTVCFNKINGRWLITHKHSSVPFNTDTGKASTGLKP